ncbi:hypothetical protein BU17DRAFT_102236 [Hysterangium stoloniferum]|nr:hypothetical protein BU17DRAFT_102236 [Hysterangium stoloniferum]
MSEFLNILHNCPNLTTHLTQRSEKYPAKPVEWAALHFCEAVAKWQGKPELEMPQPHMATKSQPSIPTALFIHTLVAHSTQVPSPSTSPQILPCHFDYAI